MNRARRVPDSAQSSGPVGAPGHREPGACECEQPRRDRHPGGAEHRRREALAVRDDGRAEDVDDVRARHGQGQNGQRQHRRDRRRRWPVHGERAHHSGGRGGEAGRQPPQCGGRGRRPDLLAADRHRPVADLQRHREGPPVLRRWRVGRCGDDPGVGPAGGGPRGDDRLRPCAARRRAGGRPPTTPVRLSIRSRAPPSITSMPRPGTGGSTATIRGTCSSGPGPPDPCATAIPPPSSSDPSTVTSTAAARTSSDPSTPRRS